jgi:hypothetical protein
MELTKKKTALDNSPKWVLAVYLAAAVTASVTSCSVRGDRGVSLNVSVHNATTTAYWVASGSEALSVGILSPGSSATEVGIPPPNIDTVTLDLTVETNRQHHTQIKLDVSTLKRLSPGHHNVTISIVSESQAKLLIDGLEK